MYDAVLVVSFGGPEKPEDVLPFLENVTRGRNITRGRLVEVAAHYDHFGGRSPINHQTRQLIRALQTELEAHSIRMPLYWGNRNWHPFLPDAVRKMRDDGVRNALAFVTSAYSSYSSCTQYRENIAAAQAEVGAGAPEIHKLRSFYNHPDFIEGNVDRVREGLARFIPAERDSVRLVATAHSIPCGMAASSDYEKQLRETARLIAERLGKNNCDLVYQSRSGPRSQPWLGPDILEHLRQLNANGAQSVLVAPIGFLSDHMEVLYDLDTEAAALAVQLGIKMVRAATIGTHPAFVRMIRELIEERLSPQNEKRAIGRYGPNHDVCPADCCPASFRRPGVSEVPPA